MPVNFINMDIIEAIELDMPDVVLHGCHCFCLMEHGVAKVLGDYFPKLKEADLKTAKGDKFKLGTFSHATLYQPEKEPILFVNGYTQFNYGKFHYQNKSGFDYDSFDLLLSRVLHRLGKNRKDDAKPLVFLMPFIGGDRGNSTPERIIEILNRHFKDEMLYVCVKKEKNRSPKPGMKEIINNATKTDVIKKSLSLTSSKQENYWKLLETKKTQI